MSMEHNDAGPVEKEPWNRSWLVGLAALSPCSRSRYSRSRTGSVRLGFEADAAIPVHRSEVWERIQGGSGLGSSIEGNA